MITILLKSDISNQTKYACIENGVCAFKQLFKAINRTTYWISELGPNYINWTDHSKENPYEDLIIDVPEISLKDELLALNQDGISYAESLGLDVNEQSTNDEIILQIEINQALCLC